MKKKFKIMLMLVCACALVLNLTGCGAKYEDEEVNLPEEIQMQGDDAIADSDAIDIPQDTENSVTMDIPQEEDTDKMVSVPVENLGRPNPFLPPGEAIATTIPQVNLKYDVLEPLDVTEADPVAKKVVTTKVSGIMFDKENPSAILNVDGSDYLVRSGDVIDGYKILSINKNHVTVQMGPNVYKTGVGQLVAEGKSEVNYNNIANLNNKFGGSKK